MLAKSARCVHGIFYCLVVKYSALFRLSLDVKNYIIAVFHSVTTVNFETFQFFSVKIITVQFAPLQHCKYEAKKPSKIQKPTIMNNIFKGLLAGYGAKKLGGGCFSTVLIFIIIWAVLGQCS